jgi:hypothetical protein
MVIRLGQIAALQAHKDIFGVSHVLGHQGTRKKADGFLASLTGNGFDPEEIFDMGPGVPAFKTTGPIEVSDVLFQVPPQGVRLPTVGLEVDVLDLLLDDPVGHGIDIISDNIAPDAIGLNQRDPASHEGVGDS